jgi:hypothetical protein
MPHPIWALPSNCLRLARFSHPRKLREAPIAATTKARANLRPIGGSRCSPGGIVFVGFLQLVVFGRQAQRLRESIDLTRTIADRQERDTRDSIAEAARAATAMRDAADAALSQVRIVIAIESPVFTWGEFKLDLIQGVVTTGISANNVYQPAFFVKNAGRSPMELRAFCIETVFRDDFRPTYDSQPNYNTIVGVTFMLERETDVRLSSPETLKFNEEEVAMIDDFKRILWMYGFVRYYNRLTNEIWEAGFIRQWNSRQGFVPYSLPNYNYHRPHKADGDTSLP